MKKYSFITAVMIGLISVSCSQDEPAASLTDAAKNQISYAVTAGNASRASSSYENGTDIKRMHVSAWLTKGATTLPGYGESNTDNAAYFTNDLMVRSAGSGVFSYTSDARYWPANGECLDFYAVVDNDAPEWNGNGTFSFSSRESGSGNGYPGLGWLKQLDIDKMPDLLYAYTPNQQRSTTNTAQQNVSFLFNHAFAKVIVTAEVKNSNLRVCITDMAICGITKGGQFMLPRKAQESGVTVTNGAKWIVSPEYTDLACPLTPYNAANPVVLDKRETAKATLVGAGEGNLKDLLVIPNTYNGRNSSGKYQTYIMLKGYAYNIANSASGFDPDTDSLIFPKLNEDGSLTPASMIIPIEFNWRMGSVNRYNIVFDCGNGGSTDENPNHPAFVRIGYEVEVSDWQTGQTIDPSEYVRP